ncbi:MAG: ATP-binding protein [Chloroflexota bacterium]|nr:ATP-binding protein [Chloroflexota bacterium]
MKRFNLASATVMAALASLAIQSPLRWGREPNRAARWVNTAAVPSLLLSSASGAILEANKEAQALFPGQPLLELDLGTLFPKYRTRIHTAIRQAEQVGAATVRVNTPHGSLMLMLASTLDDQPLQVALLLSLQPEKPPSSPPPQPPAFAPLELPDEWHTLPINEQLQSLLASVTACWPVRSATLFKRCGMTLQSVVTTDNAPSLSRLQLPAVDLGRLLQDGTMVQAQVGNHLLVAYPFYLSSGAHPWGAVVLVPNTDTHDDASLVYGAAQVARIAGLLLSGVYWRNRYRSEARQALQHRIMRDHLLTDIRRGVLLIDPKGKIEYLNEVASSLLDWPAEDVLGRPLTPLLDDLGPLGTKIAFSLTTPDEIESEPATARLQRPGKRGNEVSFTVERVSEIPGYRLIFLEDHEGVLASGETQHHLDRLAVLGKMSAMIAHDLRNPLASILYGIETLAETLGEEHPEIENINLLLKEGERIHRIIEDILSISRQPSLTISLCSLQSLTEQVHESHQRHLQEKQIQVRRYYDPSLPLIEGNPVRMGQMLDNLVSNAIDALDEGGQIEIVLRPLTLEQVIARGVSPDQEERLQGGVEILIRDNGPGIPESQREQIFEPLFTTKSSGTGLGLSIVRTIVEQHRGLIFLDSELGKGTTFQIFLPQLGSAYHEGP